MAKDAKTHSAPLDVAGWLQGVDPDRRVEAQSLLTLFCDVTGWQPRLWGPSMVGFGRYDYRYDSGHGGTSLAVGFALRKAEISLYGLTGGAAAELLPRLGPHKTGKACLYLKRLDKVDEAVLADLIRAGLEDLRSCWSVFPV